MMLPFKSERRYWTRSFFVLAIALALIGAFSFYFVASRPDSSVPSIKLAVEPLRLRWAKGSERTLRFDLKTRGAMNPSALMSPSGGREQSFASQLSGSLVIQALSARKVGDEIITRAILRFRDVTTETLLESKPMPDAPVASDFEQLAIAAEVSDRAVFRSIRLRDDTPLYVRAAVRHLLSIARVTFSEGAARDYTLKEEGLSSPWSARYQFEGAGTFRKLETLFGHFAGNKHERGEGHYEGVISPQTGELQSLKGSREKNTRVGAIVVESELSLVEAKLVATRWLSDDELASLETEFARLEELPAGGLRADSDFEAQSRAAMRKLIEGETFEGVLARVTSSPKIAARELSIMKGIFRLEPRSAEKALPFLSSRKVGDNAFQAVAAVLSVAGTPESQDVLRRAAKRRHNDDEAYASLLSHLGSAKQATHESEELLRSVGQSDSRPAVVQAARLSLATLAHGVREAAPERAERILSEQIAELSSVSSAPPTQVRRALEPIGNIGLEAQIAAIRPFLASSDTEVRKTAAAALRYVETPEAIALVLALAERDSSEGVRAMALESLSYTDPSREKLAVLRRMLASERSVLVVSEVLRQLGRQADVFPEAAAELRQYAVICGNSELCALTGQLIARLT